MTDKTKAVNLTKEEVQVMIEYHGTRIDNDNINERIERIKYLHFRLKSFSEPEITEHIKNENNAAGWTQPSNQSGENS